MGKEIERKFLVKNDTWRSQAKGVIYQQGYLNREKERVVRVRVVKDKGFLTVKGKTKDLTRSEYEYQIPVDDAKTMLNDLCEKPLIEKIRYKIEHEGLAWEVDEFLGENLGLVVAEVELSMETQPIKKPDWIGEEVTGKMRYYNANLVTHPFSKWEK